MGIIYASDKKFLLLTVQDLPSIGSKGIKTAPILLAWVQTPFFTAELRAAYKHITDALLMFCARLEALGKKTFG
jgi:hypothetical protein